MESYYNSNYYTNSGEYDLDPYQNSYDCSEIGSNPYQISYYSSEINSNPSIYTLFDYNYNTPCHYSVSDPSLTCSVNACSVSTYSEAKLIQYNPSHQFVTSYNVAVVNDTVFEEYDPTPYGGGYDISQTYGKPLPPSDEICYPRSMSVQIPYPSLEGELNTSISGLKEKEELAEQQPLKLSNESKPTTREKDDEVDLKPRQDEKTGEVYGGFGSDLGNRYENGETREKGMYEKEGGQIQYPSGYGLEAVDLCESLFGYWPCLSKMKNRGCDGRGGGVREESYQNLQWNRSVADYLFGSSDLYEESRNGDLTGNSLQQQ